MTGWTYVLGWVLVHFVWQGNAVGVAAALVLRLCRISRHRSWVLSSSQL